MKELEEAMSKCWLCGDEATTREHRIKKSTIKYLFSSEKNPIVTMGNKRKPLQSPDSVFVKHDYNLCKTCNNERTQPFDKAYEKFFDYLISREKNILKNPRINLKTLRINQQDLFKYFIKSFCCVIDSVKHNIKTIPVPKELINTLLGADYNKSLVMQFCINMRTIKYPLTKVMMVSEVQHCSYHDGTFYISYYEAYAWLNIRYVYQTVRNKKEYNFRLNKHKMVPNYWVGKSKYITFTVLPIS